MYHWGASYFNPLHSKSLLVSTRLPLSYPSMATKSMLVMAATLARVTEELAARSMKKAQQTQGCLPMQPEAAKLA